MFSQFVLQLLLPGVFLTSLWRGRFKSKKEWLLNVLVSGSYMLFVFVTARWDQFSYYLRLLIWPLFGLASFIAFQRVAPPSGSEKSPRQWLGPINLVLLFGLTELNMNALNGYFYPGNTVHLSSPLRQGVYYVGSGGSSSWVNPHRADDASGNDFALDIVRLNAFGNHAKGFLPSDLKAYAIFGALVYSPCSGTVTKAVDGLPDQIPPQRDTVNLAGNHVIIACKGVKVVMAHLMQGSLTVKTGEKVSEGEVLGRVGNSGKTRQPHLHLHAAQGDLADGILDGEGIPILLDGVFLTRNSLFSGSPR